MLEDDHDRQDRASDGDERASRGGPPHVEEATDEELSDAIAGIELDDPHSTIGHGVAPSDGIFDLDDDRAAGPERDDARGRDAEREDAGPLRSLLSRVL